MAESEFLRQQQAAINRMREFSARSTTPGRNEQKSSPDFSNAPKNENGNRNYSNNPLFEKTNNNSGFNIPLLDNIFKDGDSSLILGLLLVLMSENADKMLLFALVYILL